LTSINTDTEPMQRLDFYTPEQDLLLLGSAVSTIRAALLALDSGEPIETRVTKAREILARELSDDEDAADELAAAGARQ
jgi:hypothetical protein